MFTDKEQAIINQAKALLLSKVNTGPVLENPQAVKDLLQLKYAGLAFEVFSIMYLDNQHRFIKLDELFRGTIDGASVYVREVVKDALKYNASAVIFSHNHPSDSLTPSEADKRITKRLQDALNLVEIRVLDHMIVTKTGVFSFAENGLI